MSFSDFFSILDDYLLGENGRGPIDLSDPKNIRAIYAKIYEVDPSSMDTPSGKARIFWSGIWDGTIDATDVAFDLEGRHAGIVNQGSARLPQFIEELLSVNPDGTPKYGKYFTNFDPNKIGIYIDKSFGETSYLYARTAEGRAVTLTVENGPESVWAQDEVRGFLDNIEDPNSKLTHINDVEVDKIRTMLDQTRLDKAIFLQEFLDSKSAVNLLNAQAKFLRGGLNGTILDIDANGLSELGFGDIGEPNPIEFRSDYNTIPDTDYNKLLLNRAFNHLALLSEEMKVATNPDASFRAFGQHLHDIGDDIKNLAADDPDIKATIDEGLRKFKAVFSAYIGDEGGAGANPFSQFNELDTASKLKVGGFFTEFLLISLEAGVKAKEYDGIDTPEFQAWALKAAAAGLVVAKVGGAVISAVSTLPFGSVLAIGGIAALTYIGIKQIAKDATVAFRDEPESFAFQAACFVLNTMDALETQLKVFAAFMGSIFGDFAGALLPEVKTVKDGAVELFADGDNPWAIGQDSSKIWGNTDNNLIVHTGWGEVNGHDGNDVLIAWGPDYYAQGQLVGPEPAAPHGCDDNGDPRPIPEDNRPEAQSNLRLTLYGGDGNDNLFSFGGVGAHLIGGADRDLLFSFGTVGARLWGNETNAAENQTDWDESDMFWWSPGAFIEDADPVDFMSVFGWTLTGGSNFFTGGDLVMDSTLWFMAYGGTESNQLFVSNLIMAALAGIGMGGDNVPLLAFSTVIESYDYNLTVDDENRNDMGFRFRIWNADQGDKISLFDALWGEVVFWLDQFDTFVKGLNWRTNKDPLVLDLDGDGLETVRMSQSRANFDLDDDFFAERTGWVSSDDGLLAVDRNADGVIDDISELFGGNNPDGIEQTGFAALSDFDSNLDGVVDANDADFDKLLVWRDLDGDGTGESGDADGFGRELFSLEELGISSISTGSTAFDESTGDTENGRIIASGAILLSEGTYTRTDGSTGAVFEVIFETDTTRTIYRGDNGLATWNPAIAAGSEAGTAVNGTGRGRMADMAISAANDPHLSAVIAAQLAQTGVAAGDRRMAV